MMSKEDDHAKIKALDFMGGNCTVNWFEEGGAEVWRIWDVLVFFEVPSFGGTPRYHSTVAFDNVGINTLLDIAYSWT